MVTAENYYKLVLPTELKHTSKLESIKVFLSKLEVIKSVNLITGRIILIKVKLYLVKKYANTVDMTPHFQCYNKVFKKK